MVSFLGGVGRVWNMFLGIIMEYFWGMEYFFSHAFLGEVLCFLIYFIVDYTPMNVRTS